MTYLVNENQGEVENSILDMVKNSNMPKSKGLEVQGGKATPTPRDNKSGGCKC